MDVALKNSLSNLYNSWAQEPVDHIEKLRAHGSERQYYRMFSKNKRAIAANNRDRAENIAFLSFSKHFLHLGLPVPDIYGEDLKNNIYLEQDLGDTTLFSFLTEVRAEEAFSENIIEVYEQVIEILPRFQIIGGRDLDYSVCYPRYKL